MSLSEQEKKDIQKRIEELIKRGRSLPTAIKETKKNFDISTEEMADTLINWPRPKPEEEKEKE